MMKQFWILTAFLSLSLFSSDRVGKLPVYKIAVEVTNQTAETLILRDFMKDQIQSTGRGLVSLPIKNFESNVWEFDKEGIASGKSAEVLQKLNDVDKLALISTEDGQAVISFVDVLQQKLEYRNSLPESLSKTLVFDFLGFLDKKNIYLALSETGSGSNSQLKINSLKPTYVAGEPIRFEIEAAEDNFVYVVLVPENQKGEPVLLFPNQFQNDNFIRKGDKVTIPDKRISFKASTTPSKDRIRAFASREEWKEFQLRSKREDSFYKILPPAITGTKSGVRPMIGSQTITASIVQSPVMEWEYQTISR
ncbi:DUF4384 domain-containing protein [Leptospira bandrabouensis]|uniref:DUF4384 domain-containing protein n=1 Tax=Leptospira bandrabouensis TaxID=2484903 RepID=A0A6H3NJ63_9LEPT|nr:DUF4384 domain-containing protein [Leptospira bandrabouensis]MCW7459713.1 DUF4384 domain-containing protein [Leptospira bandrabouensis]MCW7477174.1 DUF4384 domain-containing protein [Leptospira bandrabouensis]MCW7484856.1 DUF4384 domain-containing protein [Leptospira bandrabouensis]TGN09557.1 DUF4384 domain-containing protein [Leptospira bandrabouensis]TGN10739.1 DUF4384 domain-containing protein [Leptospira bandrabouensis]